MKATKFNTENWDWYAFLASSEFTKQDYLKEAKIRAGDWVTCACGQLCKALPKESETDNEPKDMELAALGYNFFDNINNEDWESAKTTLDAIEKRSTFLLKTLKQ